MSEAFVLAAALGLAASAAAFGLAEWVAVARARRRKRIADAVLRWYLEDLEREQRTTHSTPSSLRASCVRRG